MSSRQDLAQGVERLIERCMGSACVCVCVVGGMAFNLARSPRNCLSTGIVFAVRCRAFVAVAIARLIAPAVPCCMAAAARARASMCVCLCTVMDVTAAVHTNPGQWTTIKWNRFALVAHAHCSAATNGIIVLKEKTNYVPASAHTHTRT